MTRAHRLSLLKQPTSNVSNLFGRDMKHLTRTLLHSRPAAGRCPRGTIYLVTV